MKPIETSVATEMTDQTRTVNMLMPKLSLQVSEVRAAVLATRARQL